MTTTVPHPHYECRVLLVCGFIRTLGLSPGSRVPCEIVYLCIQYYHEHCLWSFRESRTVKVAVLGQSDCGKTTLLAKRIEGKFDDEYLPTIGIDVMERSFTLKRRTCPKSVTLNVHTLSGQSQFSGLLPIALNHTKAIIFAFDLSRRKTLEQIKSWYKAARSLNKEFKPILVGTKWDLFESKKDRYKTEVAAKARSYARKMHSPLIFCSSLTAINVKRVFTVLIGSVFEVPIKLKQRHHELSEPLLEFEPISENGKSSKKSKKRKQSKRQKSKKKKQRPEITMNPLILEQSTSREDTFLLSADSAHESDDDDDHRENA